jgi:hypothetical protein
MSNKTGATGGASLSEYLSSSPYVSEVRVARSLIFCVVFCRSLFVDSFVLLILIIVFVCPKNLNLIIYLKSNDNLIQTTHVHVNIAVPNTQVQSRLIHKQMAARIQNFIFT